MRSITSLAILLLTCTFSALAAQPAVNLDAKPGPVKAFPWLHVGMRFSFKNTDVLDRGNLGAVVQQDDGSWTLDPTHGGTAVSVAQVTVVGLNADKIAESISQYRSDLLSGKKSWQSTSGMIIDSVKDEVGWGVIQPAKLNDLLKNPPQHMRASRITWNAENLKCDAVFFRGFDENGAYSEFIYDSATGLLLEQATKQRVRPGVDQQGRRIPPGTALHLSKFISSRDLHLPWGLSTPPNWVARLNTMYFQGQTVLHGLSRLTPDVRTPIDLQAKIADRIGNWQSVHNTIGVNTPTPVQFDTIWAGFLPGSGWINPDALKNLHPSQLLDEDPVTNAKLTVSHVDGNGVTFTESNDSFEKSERYDLSTGTLNALHSSDPSLHSEMLLQLRRTE